MAKKEPALIERREARDPFALMRTDFERLFNEPAWRALPWQTLWSERATAWNPEFSVFERDNRLVTRIDLPGLKKEDIRVEIAEGSLAISGARSLEKETTEEQFYRRGWEYGGFYRAVPLPDGVKSEDVSATFADGVLEVSVPLPPAEKTSVKTVEIKEPAPAAKAAA
jgi:HSP20 family protein